MTISAEDALARFKAGDDFRLQSEYGLIMNVVTGESREVSGFRMYLLSNSDRWEKTKLWVVGKEGQTTADLLRSFAALFEHERAEVSA